jgi:hypothetical protein
MLSEVCGVALLWLSAEKAASPPCVNVDSLKLSTPHLHHSFRLEEWYEILQTEECRQRLWHVGGDYLPAK